MASDFNKVQYVDQDFDAAVLAIQNFIASEYPDEFNDYAASNLGMALIDIIAYAEQNLNWYMNRKITDLYFPTAITPNSVSKIARMLGYKPVGATGSIATITVSLSQTYTFPITINRGFQFKGPNGLVFEYQGGTPIIYNPGETTKTFDVREGTTATVNFVSNGLNNQVFNLSNVPDGKFVENGSIIVLVDGIEWPEYGIIPYENIDAFESNILTRPSFIKFGDGVQGKVPSLGAGIQVRYGVVSGFSGRILKNSIISPLIPLVVQFQNIPLIITQPSNSVGGEDPEPTRKITVNAPRFQATQDRAITKNDYDFLASTFENVAKGDAQTIRTVSADVTFNNLFDSINQDLQSILYLGQSASGYQNVSGVVNSVSGNIVSIDSSVEGIETNYLNVSGLVYTSNLSVSGVHDAIQAQINILGSVSGSSVSGTIIPVISSLSSSLLTLSGEVANLNTINTSTSGFSIYPSSLLSISNQSDLAFAGLEEINSLASDVVPFVQTSGYALEASGSLQSIYDYYDIVVSDGCRANVVQVSILGKDAGRKYVAPANTTITDLKAYLDQRKDITHDVTVVSGVARVIDANVLVEVKLTDQADEDAVIQRLKDALDRSTTTPFGILVERDFNKSLYLDEVYRTCRSVVEDYEITYLNVVIQGPSQYLDSRGNLICPDGFVIQAGTITVNKLF